MSNITERDKSFVSVLSGSDVLDENNFDRKSTGFTHGVGDVYTSLDLKGSDFDSFDSFDVTGCPSDSMSDVARKSKERRMTQIALKEEEEMMAKELIRNVMVEKGPFGLGVMDAFNMAVILEDMSDQLDVIGMSIDAPQVDLRSEGSAKYDLSMHRPVLSIPPAEDPYNTSLFSEKYLLRQHYSTVAHRRMQQLTDGTQGFRKRLGSILATYGVSKFSPKGKFQAERTHANIIVDNLVTELIQSTTFNTLLDALAKEKVKYEGMREKVKKSVDDEERIVDTKRAIKTARVEKKRALAKMQTTVWGIEDSTQEMLRRKQLEAIYTQNCGMMWKLRIKKMCVKNDGLVQKDRDDLRLKSWLYGICNSSMMAALDAKYKEAQARLEYWMDKYETDKEQLQTSLDTMKMERARDLERIQWLKHWIQNYSEVVQDDRRIKNILAEKERIFQCKTRMTTRLQAWWRGEMVRKRLGPFNPKNMKKEPVTDKKKDKKGGKDKKKKK